MPDDAVILAKKAATVAEAAKIAEELGDAKTVIALQQIERTIRAEAAELRSEHYWTGSHHGDTAGP